MKQQIIKILRFILPIEIFNFLVTINIHIKRIIVFYIAALKLISKQESEISILLFPIRGGRLLKESNAIFPLNYWHSWVWHIDLIKHGANLSWENDCVTAEYDGVKLSAYAGDSSLHTVYLEKFAEDEYHLENVSLKGLSVLDIGANIGSTAITFMKKGAKVVYAFEPLPILKKYIQKNINQNGFGNSVKIHTVGLHDRNEIKRIYIRKHASAGTSTFLHSDDKINIRPGDISQDIKLVNSVEYLKENDIKNIDVLKMDCEMCEYVVFKNSEFLEYLKPKIILLEYHNGHESLQKIFLENEYEVEVDRKYIRADGTHDPDPKVGIIIARWA